MNLNKIKYKKIQISIDIYENKCKYLKFLEYIHNKGLK